MTKKEELIRQRKLFDDAVENANKAWKEYDLARRQSNAEDWNDRLCQLYSNAGFKASDIAKKEFGKLCDLEDVYGDRKYSGRAEDQTLANAGIELERN